MKPPLDPSAMPPPAVPPQASSPLALPARRPLVHCLTNPVSMNDVANALLAVGASPIMADDACESAEVTARADALLINLGVPSPGKLEAMLRSGRVARARGIPIVFDPVGVSLTAFRQQAAARILAEAQPGIIRGNFSEISFLAGQAAPSRGVDDPEQIDEAADGSGLPGETRSRRLDEAVARAEAVSRTYGAVTVLTGDHDIVTDGRKTHVLPGGSIWLTRMTGAGCILGGLIAAYAAAAYSSPGVEPIARVLLALEHYGAAARTAAQLVEATGGGSGSFRTALIDALGRTGITIADPRPTNP